MRARSVPGTAAEACTLTPRTQHQAEQAERELIAVGYALVLQLRLCALELIEPPSELRDVVSHIAFVSNRSAISRAKCAASLVIDAGPMRVAHVGAGVYVIAVAA